MKKIKYLIIVIIIIALNLFYSNFTTTKQLIYDKAIDPSKYESVGQIAESTVIKQTFLCEKSSLNALEIKFYNYERDNQSELFYKLEDSKGNTVAEGIIDASEVENDFYMIKLAKKLDSKNEFYTLTVGDQNATADTAVTIYKTSANGSGKLTAQGKYTSELLASDAIVMKVDTIAFSFETFIILSFFEAFIYLFIKLLYRFLR